MTPEIPVTEPLTAEQRARALDAVAARIRRYRLEVPAMLMLEASRPFASLTGMASFVVTPLFGAFTGLSQAEGYAALLSDRAAYDELLERLGRAPEGAAGQGPDGAQADAGAAAGPGN